VNLVHVMIPVSMFRVPYWIARGRPYSRLEQRVLEDIATRDGTTLTSLTETLRVHERLLVESVVTLVGAGWIAVTSGREATFVLTDEGAKACTSGKDPASVEVHAANPCTLVQDRTSGQLARRGEVQTVTRESARLDLNPSTPLRILRNALDESQIQKLLPRDSGEWIRTIGPTRLITVGRYAPVRVDLNDQTIVGLPRGWYDALAKQILETAQEWSNDQQTDAAAQQEGGTVTSSALAHSAGKAPNDPNPLPITPQGTEELAPDATPLPTGSGSPMSPLVIARLKRSAITMPREQVSQEPPPRYAWLETATPDQPDDDPPATYGAVNLLETLVGNEAHERALLDALSSAHRHVLIASPSVSLGRLAALEEPISAAVGRGTRVDFLYGALETGTSPADVVGLLHRMGYAANPRHGRDLLRPGRNPTRSGAGLLLFDRDSGPLEAVVGDYAWCGTPADRYYLSIHLGQPGLIGEIARAGAGLWKWAGDPVSADRWRRVAEQCHDSAAIEFVRSEATSGHLVPADVIIDDEHAKIKHAPADDDLTFVGGAARIEDEGTVGFRGITVALGGGRTGTGPDG
jgi:hypothetical protein